MKKEMIAKLKKRQNEYDAGRINDAEKKHIQDAVDNEIEFIIFYRAVKAGEIEGFRLHHPKERVRLHYNRFKAQKGDMYNEKE